MGAAIVAIVTSGVAHGQTLKMEVPAGLTLSTVTEPSPKKESKPAKGFLKELKPGSCKTTFAAPSSSWPARGEPLVAVCRQ
jgi:hypothetical protein